MSLNALGRGGNFFFNFRCLKFYFTEMGLIYYKANKNYLSIVHYLIENVLTFLFLM